MGIADFQADMVEAARQYARDMHGGHRRKYTNEPYFDSHLCEVADIVAEAGGDEEMVAAAYLHDVVEDTHATLDDVRELFGPDVAALVDQLTDKSRPEDGNRELRKSIDREAYRGAHPDAQTIKLADLISNTESILAHDPKFAAVYLREKELLLPFLRDGDPGLFDLAARQVMEGLAELGLVA